jgi:hypothetical protein
LNRWVGWGERAGEGDLAPVGGLEGGVVG